MDEIRRKLERRVAAEGDRLTRVRLAHEKLRARDAAGALEALEGAGSDGEPGTLALEATVRASALHELHRLEEAVSGLRAAVELAVLEWRPVAGVVLAALEERSVVTRACAAAVAARLREGDSDLDALRARLAQDPELLVRLALVRDRPQLELESDRGPRVYGSHGADYEMGIFVAFDMSAEDRLRYFEPRLCSAVNTALAALADDANDIEPLELRTAFSNDFGLGGAPQAPDGGAALASSVRKLNELDLVPWKLRVRGVVPYDLMEKEERLAKILAQYLKSHPARQKPLGESPTVVERIAALHPARGVPARRELVAPLMEEARGFVTPVGLAALDRFVKECHGLTRF